jgi:hypothetical protein
VDQDLQGILFFAGFVISTGCLTAIVKAWIKSRGQSRPIADARLDEILNRLGRLETSLDAAAVEIERISEGQRFTTRLLSEKARATLPQQ